MTHRRRAIGAALAASIAVAVPSALAPAVAQAAAYRYWSYWPGTEAGWSFANVGPAFRVPADGTAEGWRFAVAGVDGNRAPSIPADFDSVCAETPAEEGRKRVAVVVDPGSTSDAPDGEQPPGAWALCVVAELRATGYDVLRAAASVRTDRGLICAIGGYPARGCGDVVAEPQPAPEESQRPSPSKSPKPSTSPRPEQSTSATPAVTSSSATAPVAPERASTDPAPARSVDSSAATPSAAGPAPTPSPETTLPGTPTSPEPTYSLLTAPLSEPPSADGGLGGAFVAGIAVVGIAGLGGAAILRMRRSS